MKRKLSILFALVLVLMLFPASVSASPQPLVAVGLPKGTEATIVVVPLPPGVVTLGDLKTVSWAVYCSMGYPPHLDITLNLDEDPTVIGLQEMLTAEMAYNNKQGKELDSSPSLTTYIAYNKWLHTFELESNDGYGQIGDGTMFWLTKMGAGNDDAPSGTLAQWKAGIVGHDPKIELPSGTQISAATKIEKLEIEVDNWVLDTTAYVDNIVVNETNVVGLSAISRPPLVSISVTPTSIDFGFLLQGIASDPQTVTVINTGELDEDFSAEIMNESISGVYTTGLTIANMVGEPVLVSLWGAFEVAAGDDVPAELILTVPLGTAPGACTATLIFWAEATTTP